MRSTLLPSLALLAAPAVAQQSLVCPDNLFGVASTFSPGDGSVQSPAFVDLDLGPAAVNRPIEVLRVGGELWVSDDVLHRITRWSRFGGSQLGTIDPGFKRLGGMELAFGSVWVTSHDIVDGDFLLELDTTGNLLNAYPLPSVPEDVVAFGSELLVSVATDDLIRIDPTNGAYLGDFHSSDGVSGIDAPVQLHVRAGGNVLAAGLLPPVGIFEYDPSGNEINYYSTAGIPFGGGVVGLHELGDGNILFSSSDGVYVYDTVGLTYTRVLDEVRGHHVSAIDDMSLGTSYCGPAVPNSTGQGARIAATGSDAVAANEFRLAAYDLPSTQNGYFLCSETTGFVQNPGGAQGNLCLGGTIGRFNAQAQSTGSGEFIHIAADLSAFPVGGGTAVAPGDTWHFSCWYRDQNPGTTSNFTDGISVLFD